MKNLFLTAALGAFAMALVSSPATASGDAAAGAELFKKKCKACHSTEVGKNKNGPSLAGIIGRKAASTDFAKYTGLKGSEVVWDDDNLDKFLTNPKKFVGAKSMVIKVKKEDERDNIIAYLKTL